MSSGWGTGVRESEEQEWEGWPGCSGKEEPITGRREMSVPECVCACVRVRMHTHPCTFRTSTWCSLLHPGARYGEGTGAGGCLLFQDGSGGHQAGEVTGLGVQEAFWWFLAKIGSPRGTECSLA